MKENSEAFARKRKMMLMAPLAFVPMLCLAFYGLGGGRGGSVKPAAGEIKGLNMALPLAQFNTAREPQDKNDFYEKAKQDSMRLLERKKRDPYATGSGVSAADSGGAGKGVVGGGPLALDGGVGARQAEEALAKLEQLKQALGEKTPVLTVDSMSALRQFPVSSMPAKSMRGESAPVVDPELDRLDGMLNKLMRIQHPEVARQDTSVVMGVPAAGVGPVVTPAMSNLGLDSVDDGAGFTEIGGSGADEQAQEDAIEAMVNTGQTLTSGVSIELRITHAVTVNGRPIPANSLAHGQVSLSDERLMVAVRSIGVGGAAIPVSMQVYDIDGMAGIRVPGSMTRDVSKESADRALSGVQLATVDPSLGAQAAGAGLEFARSLASKKVRQMRLAVPAGYRVWLKNEKANKH